jgi:hypothetical protein
MEVVIDAPPFEKGYESSDSSKKSVKTYRSMETQTITKTKKPKSPSLLAVQMPKRRSGKLEILRTQNHQNSDFKFKLPKLKMPVPVPVEVIEEIK